MSEKLRLIVSGPGLIGRKHVALIRSSEECELTALVGPAVPDNQALATSCGVALHGSLDILLDQGEVDGVIVSSPNAVHFEQAMACINRRIPVLIEKPISDRLETAKILAVEAERLRVPVLVGHHRTYSPLLDSANAYMRTCDFGDLVCFQGSALFYKPVHYFQDGPWRTRVGGGPLLINLIHEVGLWRYFCGEVSSVSAMAGNHVRGYEVEDTVAISIEFRSGVLGTFLLSDTAASSKSWEMTSGENPSYPHFSDEDCYHFAGTRGSLDFPSLRVRHYGRGVDPSWWSQFESGRMGFVPVDPLELQLKHFVRVIQGSEKPRVSAHDGYMNMLVIEAISRSISTRASVRLDEIAT